MNTDIGFQKKINKLISISREVKSFAYNQFEWPDKIDGDIWWFSPESLSIYGTPLFDECDEAQLKKLSKYECANLFSLNVTGEQELISKVVSIINSPMVSDVRDYLHHFIEEESQHMWYFNEFCKRYIGKIYDKKTVDISEYNFPKDVDILLIFSRIAIFEEVGHHFNVSNSQDKKVHPFVSELNRAHQFDEGRHISFGRRVIKKMAMEIVSKYDEKILLEIEKQLQLSMKMVVESFYNPAMYRDSGMGRGMVVRQKLLDNPFRKEFNENILLGKIRKLLIDSGLVNRRASEVALC